MGEVKIAWKVARNSEGRKLLEIFSKMKGNIHTNFKELVCSIVDSVHTTEEMCPENY
jgi:hypothetical protein